MKQKETDVEEVIVHQYKLRFKGDYYRVLVTGSKYEAEKYMKTELKADEIIWEKSFVTTKEIAIRVGTGNKTIAMQGCFLRMEFLYQLTTKRSKPLTNKEKNAEEAEVTYDKFLNHEIDTIPLRTLRKAKRISAKSMADDLSISESYLNYIETYQRPVSITLRGMIADYLEVSDEDIEWERD